MKNLQELLDKLDEEHSDIDNVFDFCFTDLVQFVPFKKAKRFLKKDVTIEEFEEYYRPLTEGNVIGCMEEYIKFAWDKCLDERGGSATRTIAHYHAWLWIIDDDKTLEFLLDDNNYACFGAPILQFICNKYKWNLKDLIEPWQVETAIDFIKGKGC